MDRTFPKTLSALRREKNISQRKAAADLGISQALLSHYENGTREPGLEAARIFIDRLRGIVSEAERALTGPELKTGD